MNYIKSLHIEGFKKFNILDVEFNKHMNILVGENEAGKSTILDAIKVVLNQKYKNSDKSILKDLFNTEQVEQFYNNPDIENLPKIIIEIELNLDYSIKNSEYFYGEVFGDKKAKEEKFGIRFECIYDDELGIGIENFIHDGNIPYEYYNLTWTTFANRPYQIIKRPLGLIFIDTTDGSSSSSFNYYNKSLFNNTYDETTRAKAKNNFRSNVETSLKLPEISKNREFKVDSKKVILENVISVYEDSISLENRGSGMESLIKTQIALDKVNNLELILMEEPENHLSFSNLNKMLNEISEQKDNSQIIVSTHSNMIASRLNLHNVLWISDEKIKSLKSVDDSIANFFVKACNNSFLQLLLSEKVFLVEGPTEFILLPKFYKQIIGRTLEEDKVSIISCNGISYNKYLEIAKETNKRIAVITDNDKDNKRIEFSNNFNGDNDKQHIFMDSNIENWTWEVCIYNNNKEKLYNMITIDNNSSYKFNGNDYGKVLGKMLNNKADTAYKMLLSEEKFEVPRYVKDAIEWLNA